MPGVTEQQIIAARQMTAIEFLQRYRPEELVKAGSCGEFQLRTHDSFKINGETSNFHWKSRDIGGKSALDYLVKVEEMRFVDAVLTLCEESPGYIPPPYPSEQKKEFVLPPAAESNRRVSAYLTKRGIDRKVIEACLRAGILYESADYHNAVFVGRTKPVLPVTPFFEVLIQEESPSRQRYPAATNGFASCCRLKEKQNGLLCTKRP